MYSKEHILKLLSKMPLSTKELSQLTGFAESGIRGRISDLRKDGHIIEHKSTTSKKYFLTKNNNYLKFVKWLNENDNYHTMLDYRTVSKALDIPLNDVVDLMFKVHKEGALFQHSNTKVVITRKL